MLIDPKSAPNLKILNYTEHDFSDLDMNLIFTPEIFLDLDFMFRGIILCKLSRSAKVNNEDKSVSLIHL